MNKVELNFEKEFSIKFQWQMSRMCNKSCFYCTTQKEKEFSKEIYQLNEKEKKEFEFIKDNLKDFFYRMDKIDLFNVNEGFLNLFGGEPFLHPELSSLIKEFTYFFKELENNDKNFKLFVTTNGSRLYDLKEFDFVKDKIFFSVSYHYFNTKIDDFIKQVKYLDENNISYVISSVIPNKISTNDKTYEKYKKNIKKILDNNLRIEFKYELNPFDLTTIPSEKADEFIKLNKKIDDLYMYSNYSKLKINNKEEKIFKDFFFRGFPIFKQNLCYNFQPGIFFIEGEPFLGFSCNEGESISIQKLISSNQTIYDFFEKNHKIVCKRKTCTESRHDLNPLKMFTSNNQELKRLSKFLKREK